jgi:hypothetical protein
MIAVAILFMDLRYEPELGTVGSDEAQGEASVEDQVKRERDAQLIAESIQIIRKVSLSVSGRVIDADVRQAEIRWSRYCAGALGIEIVVVVVVVGVIVAASVAR